MGASKAQWYKCLKDAENKGMDSIPALEKRAGGTGETFSKGDAEVSIVGEKVSNLDRKKSARKLKKGGTCKC